MTLKERLFITLQEQGLCSDWAIELDRLGLLYDTLVERYLIKMEYNRLHEVHKNKRSGYGLIYTLSEQFNKSEETIRAILYNKGGYMKNI